jgi:hypothetical protein
VEAGEYEPATALLEVAKQTTRLVANGEAPVEDRDHRPKR